MRKRILAGILAVMINLSMALPMRASADWDDHYHGDHHRDHHEWRWERDHDHYRAYQYAPPPAYSYNPGNRYGYRGYRAIPENGEGMVNPRHPGLIWSCDSDGHHCNWARRR